MRESWLRLGLAMFSLYLAAGAFYIPLMTLVSHSAEKGGLGFTRWGQSCVTLGIACGFLLSLALIKRLEALVPSRPQLLAGVVFLQMLVTGAMYVGGSYLVSLSKTVQPIPETHSIAFSLGVFCFASLSCSSISLLHAIILESSWKETFSWFRVLGTIGYIVAGLMVGFLFARYSLQPIVLAFGFLLTVLTTILTARATPAPAFREGVGPLEVVLASSRSLGALIKQSGVGTLVLVAFSSAVSRIYELNINVFLSEQSYISYPSAVQMIGQSLEVILLLLMPTLASRFSYRGLMLLGPLAWTALYVALAFSQALDMPWMIFLGLPLQGFNCLFQTSAVVMIGQRSHATEKGVMQALLGAAIGIGMFAGTLISNGLILLFRPSMYAQVMPHIPTPTHTGWLPIWAIASILAAILLVGTLMRNQLRIKQGRQNNLSL